MNTLEQIRLHGFTLRAVENGLYIEPVDNLSDEQRQWLINNKPEIRQQLLAERWRWFLSLATNHGIHPEVIAAEFPSDTDRLDVIEPLQHDEDTLRACMKTLCANARVKQRQADYDKGRWLPVDSDSSILTQAA